MQVDDIDQVHNIDLLSFHLAWPRSSFNFEVERNTASQPWVAVLHDVDGIDRIVAMIVIWVILDEAHIATFAVHPAYRLFGVGRKLLKHALQQAYHQGARMAFLEVRRGNQAAQSLYSSFGFKVDGVRRHYYQDNHEDALLMTLEPLSEESLKID
jgi:ribosomal-protein-alanine N-acetyltransferase